MDITAKLWQGEPLKLTFKFTDGDYVVTSVENDAFDFLKTANFAFSSGNFSVNPTGIIQSSTLHIEVYSSEDVLNPTNRKSPYYKDLVNGIEVICQIDFGNGWEPYGTWYVTYWEGGYSDGAHNINSLSLEDSLNSTFSVDMPKIEASSGESVETVLKEVFEAIGIVNYYIDPSLDLSVVYLIAEGGKVRDFINSICQLLFARCVVGLDNIIRIYKAFDTENYTHSITLGPDYLVSLKSSNTQNINYNAIKVSYLGENSAQRATILQQEGIPVEIGENTLSLDFSTSVLSVEQVSLTFERANIIVNNLTFNASQKHIDITFSLDSDVVSTVNLLIEGIIIGTDRSFVEYGLSKGSKVGGITYEVNVEQVMTDEEAEILAENLSQYIETMRKTVSISGTALTPRIEVGDVVIIEDTGTSYDAEYKVLSVSVTFGEDYSLNLELVRVVL